MKGTKIHITAVNNEQFELELEGDELDFSTLIFDAMEVNEVFKLAVFTSVVTRLEDNHKERAAFNNAVQLAIASRAEIN